MTLCDAGPLLALVNPKGEPEQNARCKAALPSLSSPLVTTWPCFTEAMYLAGEMGGWPMQQLLWRYVQEDKLQFHDLTAADINMMRAQMERFQSTPMDLADASLVAAAEALGERRVFTLDSDFRVYRLGSGRQAQAFEVVP